MWTRASALLLLACCLWAAMSVWEDPIQFNNKAKDLCTMSVTGQGDVTRLRISCQGAERTYWCEYTGKPQMCRAYNNNPRHYFTQIMWDLRKLQNACQAPKAIKPQMCKRAPEDAQMFFSASSTPEAASAATPQKPEKTQESTQAKPETPKTPIVKQAKPAATKPEQPRPEPAKPEARPAPTKPVQSRPVQAKPEQARPAAAKPAGAKPTGAKPAVNKTAVLKKLLTPKPTTPKPTKPTVKSNAKKIAQEYCWQSLQGICSYVIGWFQN
ncbi:fibroblast growth factor binding protein 2a [Salvelinus namaycush]|uniref:Fibroblast growth factor binding protein 2a n=1 Tax=Salvelinus namaycush TaxID=8040 RepID=A0A8U1F1I5_SALNM|nr:fibroblast growth factor binding protein 2a [Salvelinus namaycush]